MRVSSRRGARRFSALAGAVLAAALFLVLLGAERARAVEFVYWDNAGETPATVGWTSLDGSSGGPLSSAGVEIDGPEGMSYDPVTDRLYLASRASSGGSGLIAYLNRDGSGGGVLAAPAAAPVEDPRGVVVDPVARIAYWLNTPVAEPETISWARLDGSEGGVLPLQGATLLAAIRLAVDPAGGRIYWGNDDGSVGFAPLVGSGGSGGTLQVQGAGAIGSLVVDPTAGRLYWTAAGIAKVFGASLSSAIAEEVGIGSAALIAAPSGLAFDPTLTKPRLYWANEGNGTNHEGAIGFTGVVASSMGGKVSPPASAPVNGPQDPVIVKSPVNTAPPTIPEGPRPLTCLQGSWAPDYVSSFVYQAATSFSYQWTLNEEPIPGATEPSYPAPFPGHYKCIVTASNAAGSTSKVSQGVIVTITVRPRRPPPSPAKLVLAGKARKLKARPGRLLVLRVGMANQGTVASSPAKLCLRLTEKAKRALKAGDCVVVGPLAGGATAKAKLKLRVKRRARPGVYRLKITLAGAALAVRVKVLG